MSLSDKPSPNDDDNNKLSSPGEEQLLTQQLSSTSISAKRTKTHHTHTGETRGGNDDVRSNLFHDDMSSARADSIDDNIIQYGGTEVEDIDIIDVLDNDNVDRHELITNDKLELELDQPSSGDASDVNAHIDEQDIGDSIDFASGEEFNKQYDRLLEIGRDPVLFQQMNNVILSDFVLFEAGLVFFVQDTKANIANYKNKGRELCLIFNGKRIETGEAMERALDSTENGIYKSYINLGSYFSIDHLIGIILHYAPFGCVRVCGERYNYMHPKQVCISTMKTKIPNFLIGEAEHGIEVQQNWAFGGRTRQDNDKADQIATVDAIPVLLEKEDSDSRMRKQYETWTERFGLENFYQLMIIPYCLFQMHILLFQVCHPMLVFQVLVASSSAAKYIFGLGAGIQKYLTRFISEVMRFEVSFCCHPQAWLMGMVKSSTRFPKVVREYMSKNLVRVY